MVCLLGFMLIMLIRFSVLIDRLVVLSNVMRLCMLFCGVYMKMCVILVCWLFDLLMIICLFVLIDDVWLLLLLLRKLSCWMLLLLFVYSMVFELICCLFGVIIRVLSVLVIVCLFLVMLWVRFILVMFVLIVGNSCLLVCFD